MIIKIMTYQELETCLKLYTSDDDLKLIKQAYDIAKKAHQGQLRKSGETYINHPLAVALILAKIRLDATTIAAALLHDTIEDTSLTKKDIIKLFGKDIYFLVEGASKLGQVRIRKDLPVSVTALKEDPAAFYSFNRQVNVLRKMFIAMAQDIRIILIKLADRLHNMETLQAVSPPKQFRIAQETLQIYAPIADRLGIGELKGALEDLAFPYVFPQEYQKLQKLISKRLTVRTKYLEKVKKVLLKELEENHIKADIHGRTKHIYSLYRKLQRYDHKIDQIYDLVALRIIVNSIEDCYAVLGIIHKTWKPLTGRIKDYVAVPKPNGYQSLHTTVFCLDGQITEFQIRTWEMHEQAEYGIAAHWLYKTHQIEDKIPITDHHELRWVQQLASWQNKSTDAQELAESLKLDFFQDRIFVFTPKGDVHNLPEGATPVDFAFAVHTDVGMHCAGAKVNGKMVTLNHQLKNGDMIEIITNKKASPKSDWLNFIKTSHARSIIKQSIQHTSLT